MSSNHADIVSLALRICEIDAKAKMFRANAPHSERSPLRRDMMQQAAALDDDVGQLCVEMKRLCA